MLFQASFSYPNNWRTAVHSRFKESGDAPPPANVKLIGRWHSVEGNSGTLIADAEEASSIASWLHDWTDLVTFEVSPVLTDEEFAEMIG